jgi:ribonuclease Y
MDLKIVVLLLGVVGLLGIGFGYFLRYLISLSKRGSLELQVKQIILDAKEEAKQIKEKAEKEANKKVEETKKEVREKEEVIRKSEDRLIKKEELLDKRQTDLQKESETISSKAEALEAKALEIENLKQEEEKRLSEISGLTKEAAKEELLRKIQRDYEEDVVARMHKLETVGKEKIEARAKDILVTAIHRFSKSVPSEVMSTTVTLPSDEVKGKIIGKEGRNIKAFERASGVEVIVDDTPGAITLSSFDPVRRHVAKLALENLIADGRIQPAKIEDEVEKARQDINQIIKEKGEKAAYEVGVYNLDPRVLAILGRLYFRTSYGQNVLQHSVEMAHIAGMLAEELGADIQIAKAGALVHDIGKAVDHEIAGTHVEIGRRILQKFGAEEPIIKAMQAHHEEYPFETIESIIVHIADIISGARPGARRDTVENYLKRLAELEEIATSENGVEKAYAIEAGREVRIFVTPEKITDLEAKNLAKDIARKIEAELKYPGEIKVHVIRETRVVEYAR